MSSFGVIVCPKCREHAQIIETSGPKKTRCQKCGSNLEIRKLRIFFQSGDLDEAISARTVIQARLHGQEKDVEAVFSDSFNLAETPETTNFVEFGVSLKDFKDKRKLRKPKRSKNQIILDILRLNGGRMDIKSLGESASEHGIDEDDFEKIIEKLISSGEIYEPSTGILGLI
ncbi:MAG: hypothetical protein AWU59_410 [Methanolobus sp. T82-4]|nr:MAG: hypothetical protein AWU59_410 [Methanolobus sp. T82-4]